MALIGVASLARMAFSGADLAPVGAQLLARAAANPSDADALMDMSTVLHLRGNRDLGLALQAQALDLRQVYRVGTGEGPGSGLRVLVLVSPGDTVCASNCDYVVSPSGAWLRASTSDVPRDLSRSRIYVPIKPSRKDKYGNLRLTA